MKDSYLHSLLGENEQIILVEHQHWLVLGWHNLKARHSQHLPDWKMVFS